MKRNGFTFSIDGIFAISLLLIATLAVYSINESGLNGIERGSELLRYRVVDEAFVEGFYHNSAPSGEFANQGIGTKVFVCDFYYQNNIQQFDFGNQKFFCLGA